MALVELSIVEQRYRAVLAVQAGEPVVEVAARTGVSRQTIHSWLARYDEVGLAGLEDRSRRPQGCAHRASPEVEAYRLGGCPDGLIASADSSASLAGARRCLSGHRQPSTAASADVWVRSAACKISSEGT